MRYSIPPWLHKECVKFHLELKQNQLCQLIIELMMFFSFKKNNNKLEQDTVKTCICIGNTAPKRSQSGPDRYKMMPSLRAYIVESYIQNII